MKYSFSHPNRLTKHFYSLSFPSSIDNSNDSLFTQFTKLNDEENKRKNNKFNVNLIHFKTIYQKGIPCKKIRELIDFKNSSIITDNKIQKKTKYPLLMKNYFSFNQNKSKDKFNYLFISKSHKKGLNLKKNKKENHNSIHKNNLKVNILISNNINKKSKFPSFHKNENIFFQKKYRNFQILNLFNKFDKNISNNEELIKKFIIRSMSNKNSSKIK